MSSLLRSTSDSSSFTTSFNLKPSKSLSSLLVCSITLYHQLDPFQPPFVLCSTQKNRHIQKFRSLKTTAHIDKCQTESNSRRKEVSCQITLICINTMDCGIANLETGYPKPDSVSSGRPSGILKTDLKRVLVRLLSGIGLNKSWLAFSYTFETVIVDNFHSVTTEFSHRTTYEATTQQHLTSVFVLSSIEAWKISPACKVFFLTFLSNQSRSLSDVKYAHLIHTLMHYNPSISLITFAKNDSYLPTAVAMSLHTKAGPEQTKSWISFRICSEPFLVKERKKRWKIIYKYI